MVALADDPEDAGLRARIDIWRSADPAHESAWRDTAYVHGLMTASTPAAPGTRPVDAKTRHRDMGHRLRQRIAAGVATAVAASLLLVFAPVLVLRLQADEVTAPAEVRSVTLDDGTIVLLGADSAIAVRSKAGGRSVRLLKGEAFFDVVRDPQRPFTVGARDVDVTVLGTSFNVRLAGDGAEVEVATGIVQVAKGGDAPAAPVRLDPGDWVRLGGTGKVERGIVRSDEVASWRHGQIVARDRPMADVVDELRRHYSGAIIFADSALGERRVTGVYNLADPKAALSAMVGAHGGSVRQVSPWLLIAQGS